MPDNRIEFFLIRSGCLGDEVLTGKGSYKLKKDKLKIKFDSHNKKFESDYRQLKINDQTDYTEYEFKIIDEENDSVPFANILYKNTSNEIVGSTANRHGIAKISIPDSLFTVIQVSFVGNVSAFIKTQEIRPGIIEVKLKKGNTIFLDQTRITMKVEIFEKTKKFEIKKMKIK